MSHVHPTTGAAPTWWEEPTKQCDEGGGTASRCHAGKAMHNAHWSTRLCIRAQHASNTTDRWRQAVKGQKREKNTGAMACAKCTTGDFHSLAVWCGYHVAIGIG